MRFVSFICAAALAILPSVIIASPSPDETQLEAAAPHDFTPQCIKDAPAFADTKKLFEGYKQVIMFAMGSIINDEPTHTELYEAAKWKLGKLDKLLKDAKDENKKDTNVLRRDYFAIKIGFVQFEMSAAATILSHKLPKLPWLGKIVAWAQDKWNKLKAAWEQFWHPDNKKPSAAPAPSNPAEVAKGVAEITKMDSKLEQVDRHLAQLEAAENSNDEVCVIASADD